MKTVGLKMKTLRGGDVMITATRDGFIASVHHADNTCARHLITHENGKKLLYPRWTLPKCKTEDEAIVWAVELACRRGR